MWYINVNVTVLLYQNMATCPLNLFHNMYVSVHIQSYQMLRALYAVFTCIFTMCITGVVGFPGEFFFYFTCPSCHVQTYTLSNMNCSYIHL